MPHITLEECRRRHKQGARLYDVLTRLDTKPYSWTDFTVFIQYHPKSGTWTYGYCGEGTVGQTGNPHAALTWITNNPKENN